MLLFSPARVATYLLETICSRDKCGSIIPKNIMRAHFYGLQYISFIINFSPSICHLELICIDGIITSRISKLFSYSLFDEHPIHIERLCLKFLWTAKAVIYLINKSVDVSFWRKSCCNYSAESLYFWTPRRLCFISQFHTNNMYDGACIRVVYHLNCSSRVIF